MTTQPASGGEEAAGARFRLDVTNSTTALANLDNRDDRRADVASRANDGWSVLYNRLNLDASRDSLRFQLRLDALRYVRKPAGEDIAQELTSEEPEGPSRAVFLSDKRQEAQIELSSRFHDMLYPAKFALEYSGRYVEVTAGDFYAQLGRGFVLSVRKVDELGSDTTIRGLRGTSRFQAGRFQLRATAMAGVLNPLRVDEASGRALETHASVRRDVARITELGMPRADTSGAGPCQSQLTCSFSPDRVIAGGLQIKAGGVASGTQASWLLRQDANPDRAGFDPLSPDVSRSASRILTASQFLDVPNLGAGASLYVEAAYQQLTASDARAQTPDGHALYVNSSWSKGPIGIQLEAKHYRRFFPLAANVSLSRAREFSGLQYNSVPTTTPIWLDTEFESFNTCASGGRLQGDVALSRHHSVFAWLGRYRSWAERVSNERCDTASENANDVWHSAIGIDLASTDGRSRGNANFGVRFDDARSPLTDLGTCTDPFTGQPISSCARGLTGVFYREAYLRYDVVQHLSGRFALQLQGWHRRRRQTQGGPPDPWLEGQHLTALEWGSKASVAVGLEYDQKPGTPSSYVNGQATWRPTPSSSLALSGGQRRSMLRCVSGICRILPAFEGVRLDATLRF